MRSYTVVIVCALVVLANVAAAAVSVVECTAGSPCVGGLVCNLETNQCEPCQSDLQCQALSSEFVCKANPLEGDLTGVCAHKPLTPLSRVDIWGSVLLAAGSALAAGSGLGGGGLFVPLLSLVHAFTPGEAIPISKAMIFGSAVASTVLNWSLRHPRADRPLIDVDAALLLEPMTLSGAVIGVILNVVLPPWLVLLGLVALLSYTTYRTALKALTRPDHDSKKVETAVPALVDGGDAQVRALLAEERSVPMWKLQFAGANLFCILMLSLAKGGGGAPSFFGIAQCSGTYWMVVLAPLPLTIAATWWLGKQLVARNAVKVAAGYPFVSGDIRWTEESTTRVPAICFLAGIIAGLMGIGGGMIKGPLLLQLGLRPEIAAATSTAMILQTAATTTLSFVVLGVLPLDYGLWFVGIGFASALVGQLALTTLVRKYNSSEVIVMVIAVVVGVSTVLLAYSGARDLLRDWAAGAPMGWRPLCHAK